MILIQNTNVSQAVKSASLSLQTLGGTCIRSSPYFSLYHVVEFSETLVAATDFDSPEFRTDLLIHTGCYLVLAAENIIDRCFAWILFLFHI